MYTGLLLRFQSDPVEASLWYKVTNTKYCLLARWIRKFICYYPFIVVAEKREIESEMCQLIYIEWINSCERRETDKDVVMFLALVLSVMVFVHRSSVPSGFCSLLRPAGPFQLTSQFESPSQTHWLAPLRLSFSVGLPQFWCQIPFFFHCPLIDL